MSFFFAQTFLRFFIVFFASSMLSFFCVPKDSPRVQWIGRSGIGNSECGRSTHALGVPDLQNDECQSDQQDNAKLVLHLSYLPHHVLLRFSHCPTGFFLGGCKSGPRSHTAYTRSPTIARAQLFYNGPVGELVGERTIFASRVTPSVITVSVCN